MFKYYLTPCKRDGKGNLSKKWNVFQNMEFGTICKVPFLA
jgi:hypothetical protein